ncbi:AraC family transcriptional regulator [Kushneria marisflavi]|uniref:AraC family transcriptional regulator n=1 Tax=Kushneria marisflavi TaxID=157779 RepID=A0A240UMI7_9GAMM|nr:AraC family transcriptional regulator [Kushneria marisflavi]ART62704.1 AraC family transcriptional regulator [Kushneria marisflavi]RKD83898.1 AraC family transcriptional regulator [Kushneria marisflavi]
MSEKASFALSSDLISELLTGMRLRGVQYRRIQTGPEFGLGFDKKPGHAYFHYLAVGTAMLRTRDGALHELKPGSAVFIPHGKGHQLLSDVQQPFREIDTFDATQLGESVSGVDTCPSTHPTPSAVLFYGCMTFDLGGMQALEKLMPDVMVADAHGERYPGLPPILDAMKREICSGRIGFAGVLARLAEVAAAMIVRGWIESGCENVSGLVAALRDPRLARAILALHRQPGREWTVAQLAAESHVSRSVFAQRFQSTIGVSPLRYATELRMSLASRWLADDRLSIDTVAQRLGYTSQAAFSRAFKRINGHSPGASRRQGSIDRPVTQASIT